MNIKNYYELTYKSKKTSEYYLEVCGENPPEIIEDLICDDNRTGTGFNFRKITEEEYKEKILE